MIDFLPKNIFLKETIKVIVKIIYFGINHKIHHKKYIFHKESQSSL